MSLSYVDTAASSRSATQPSKTLLPSSDYSWHTNKAVATARNQRQLTATMAAYACACTQHTDEDVLERPFSSIRDAYDRLHVYHVWMKEQCSSTRAKKVAEKCEEVEKDLVAQAEALERRYEQARLRACDNDILHLQLTLQRAQLDEEKEHLRAERMWAKHHLQNSTQIDAHDEAMKMSS